MPEMEAAGLQGGEQPGLHWQILSHTHINNVCTM